MKITDLNYLKNNGKHIDIIKYKNNTIWKRVKKEFGEPGVILEYTASDNTTEPYELLHGSSNYITTITGEGPYTYTISTDDITDLPTRISFKNCDNLLTLDYICDTSNITDMSNMFYGCSRLNSVNLRKVNAANVTTMKSMFSGCSALTDAKFNFIETSATLTDTSYMFNECTNLNRLYINWINTSNVTSMQSMFYNCQFLESLDLSLWNTSNTTNMRNMFANCSSLTELCLGDGFNTDNIIYNSNMFLNCNALNFVEFSSGTTTNTIENIAKLLPPYDDADYGEYIINTIDCDMEVISEITSSLGIKYRGWTISKVDPSKLYTVLKYTISMSTTSGEVEPILHGSGNYLVYEESETNYAVCTDDETYLPTKISFINCAIATLDYICDTSNITDMSDMFYECRRLATLDVSNWDTSNVTDMQNMFYNCFVLTSLDLSNFDTSNVTDMSHMFAYCYNLATLNLSNFNMNNVTDTDVMFMACESLTTLRLDNCSNDTINKIITSLNFPTFTDGTTHKIYCKQTNANGLTPPTGWTFNYV